ncbi:MAG: 2-C-methyl-D-erythritol 4-phosphate cytidylyltransferase [Solirubrobacterales bacterium]|nr:2-C-methyl-D-erythritol 4-phosphate cytidylyltransferase [Solirubrobacterales bacterium]
MDRASEQVLVGCAAFVVAAGSGERLGAGVPKAFVVLAGRPLVAFSLGAILAAGVPRAVVAVPPGHGAAAEAALADLAGQFPLGLAVVEGGATRSGSVRNSLAAAGDVEAIVVHDAARPLAEPELFTRTLAALAEVDCAVAAARVTDTIKEAGPDGLVVRTHDRSRLWAIQTPQAFRAQSLRRALDVTADVLAAATDDAWLVERAGGSVRVIESPPANFKVTTPHDLKLAERLLC